MGAVVHACNTVVQEAETGQLQVQGQPQQLNQTPSQIKKMKTLVNVVQWYVQSLVPPKKERKTTIILTFRNNYN